MNFESKSKNSKSVKFSDENVYFENILETVIDIKDPDELYKSNIKTFNYNNHSIELNLAYQKPDKIIYDDYYGNILREEYHDYGDIHREYDAPAVIEYYPSGKVKSRMWMLYGFYHRSPHLGAAIINYYENGQYEEEIYMVLGHIHRPFNNLNKKLLPAHIKYHEDGSVFFESYYIENIKINSL